MTNPKEKVLTLKEKLAQQSSPSSIKHYTVAEVSKLLCMTEGIIRQYIRKGELQASRVGRDYRISELSIHNFMTSKLLKP